MKIFNSLFTFSLILSLAVLQFSPLAAVFAQEAGETENTASLETTSATKVQENDEASLKDEENNETIQSETNTTNTTTDNKDDDEIEGASVSDTQTEKNDSSEGADEEDAETEKNSGPAGNDTASSTLQNDVDDDDKSMATSSSVLELSTEFAASSTVNNAQSASSTGAATLNAQQSPTEGIASTTLQPAASSTTTIVSGQSIALANILNMVNSNFVNSEGVVLFSNFFDTVMGAIDFRQYFDSALAYGCSLVSCQGQNVSVHVDNNASIDNEVVVSAVSGNNAIDGADNAVIETGNAYAGLNLINVANTNLVDSSYLLVTLNAFQDVNGDVVFPSLSQFFNSLAHGASTPESINITNSAEVHNSVAVEADAGGNTTNTSGTSTIHTGDAQGTSNIFNQLNSSLIGGQSVSVVFRVHGSWAGEIFGAPDNLAWTAGDDGSIYLFDVGDASSNGSLSMQGTSTAAINNNVNVMALTGNNAITNAQTAVISSGNAYAGANIINVANANVVGRNWILAVINIFGDFNGNIAFGRPDLWVGGQVDVPDSISNGNSLNYTYTILNNGDSVASDVSFTTQINGNYLLVGDATHEYTKQGNMLTFELGDIPAQGAVEISYPAVIANTAWGTDIVSTASVESWETDNNDSDNTEVLAVRTDTKKTGDGIRIELNKSSQSAAQNEAGAETEDVDEAVALALVRLTPNIAMNIGNSTSEQKIVLRNTTGSVAQDVVLHDILRDPSGNVIRDEVWELKDVLPYEEIELGYLISFNPGASYGTYTLDTKITGSNVHLELVGNGTIAYEPLALDNMPLYNSILSDQSSSIQSALSDETSASSVIYAKETPLIPSFSTAAIASAAEKEGAQNTQLASAFGSGVPIDFVSSFFIAVSALLAFSLMRFFRWF